MAYLQVSTGCVRRQGGHRRHAEVPAVETLGGRTGQEDHPLGDRVAARVQVR